jgi:hypothetical protein
MGLTSDQISALSQTQVDGLTSAQIGAMAATQLNGLRSAQLASMAATQLDGLTWEQVESLANTQLDGLSSTQLGSFADSQLDGLSAAHIAALANTQLDGLSSGQLANLSVNQLTGATSDAIRLEIYNGAMLEIGERSITSLTESTESRRLLDRAWNGAGGAVNYCLGKGQWRFARRSVELVPDTNITPSFGFQYVFPFPSDFLRTCALCVDGYQEIPLTRYIQEGNAWFADVDRIYLTYVSSGASYGGNLSGWPADFVRMVEVYLAWRVCLKLTQDKTRHRELEVLLRRCEIDAASSDAMEGPTRSLPPGSWTRSRHGGRIGQTDRGSRTSLIG